MPTKTKSVDDNYVRMYYEHQYERIGKQEESRLTITNYVITLSALAFTFGYQNVVQLTVINGIGLPLIILIANLFAIAYINRTKDFINAHRARALEILERYAPVLKEINELHRWRKGRFLLGRGHVQIGIHWLLILTALIPASLYLYQIL